MGKQGNLQLCTRSDFSIILTDAPDPDSQKKFRKPDQGICQDSLLGRAETAVYIRNPKSVGLTKNDREYEKVYLK